MQILRKQYQQFVREFENKVYPNKKELIFLGIGTNKIVGDCIGPLVGSYLQEIEKRHSNIYVKGTMKNPIDINTIAKLKYKKDIEVVAIDSAMINGTKIGDVFVAKSPIILGEAVGMPFVEIGNYAIKVSMGTTTRCKKRNIEVLKKVPMHKAVQLAKFVANGICEVIEKRS